MHLLTAFTDYLLAAAGAVFAIKLELARGGRKATTIRLWSAAFVAAAVAAALGGTFHGLGAKVDAPLGLVLWKGTVYSVGLASFFMLCATATAALRPPAWNVVIAGALIKFMGYAWWMATHNSYRYVVFDYASSLLAVLLLQAWTGLVLWQNGSGWVSAGVLLAFAGAGIQRIGWSGYAGFNNNDLYHLVQIASLYLFYRGARLARDR